jgi:predicted ATPase
VGKTRLALEVARSESVTLADGGYVVELAPVGDPAAVTAAIASALDVPDASRLAEMIGDRELVIVLDNCEHLIDAAATMAEELLRRCPRLRLVATSREALRVTGETVWAVPPLTADDAAQLFVARAHAAGAPLEASDDLLPLIADICARLDGLPLAIELAAARSRALPIHQISSRLNDRFRLLTGGSRTALPRQQTLQAVVDWSYDLLFDAEQRVFERLSVFPGGCELATAEAVCTDDTITADDIADIIQALVEKSLVVAHRIGDTVRFTQLQTLCHYGRQRLSERDDAKRVRAAMAAHFAQLAGRGKAAFTGPDQGPWLKEITPEQDNLRAALEWAIDNDDAETALLIAGGSAWSHWLSGTAVEGKRWLDDAFACAGDVTDGTRALALAGRGLLHSIAGAMADAEADLHDALEIFRRLDDVSGMAFTLSFYAEIARLVGNMDEARRRRTETLTVYPADSDDTFVLAAREYSHAILAMIDNDRTNAEHYYRTAADGFAASHRPVMLSMTLGILADFDERAGRYADAVKELERAVDLAHEVGMRGFVGSLYSRLAWSLLQDGDVARAEAMNHHALEAGRRLRSPHILYAALTGSALVHRHHGRDREAAAAATEALQILETEGASRFRNRIDPDFEIQSVAAAGYSVLGVVAISEGDCATGAEMLEKADQLRASVGAPVPAFQADDVARARLALAAHQSRT